MPCHCIDGTPCRCRRGEAFAPTQTFPCRFLTWISGFTRLLRGDLATAVGQIEQAMQISAQLGGISKLDADAGCCYIVALVVSGDLERAEMGFSSLFTFLSQPSMVGFARSWGAFHHYYYGWLRWQQGRFDDVRAIAQEMDAVASPHEWPIAHCARLLIRSLLAIADSDIAQADQLLRQAIVEQRRYGISLVMGDARMLLAYNALRDHRHEDALALVGAILDEYVQRGTPGVLLMSGRSIVTPLLQFAHTNRLHTATVERLLYALGAALPSEAQSGTFQHSIDALTTREREVLQLMARGASNQAIADTLVISLHTTKSHVAHILAKLGVTSRTEAIARAREQGLIG